MASQEKTNTFKKITSKSSLSSLAWLVEVSFRGFAGWLILSNFDNILTTAVAVYSLGTSGLIVVKHFFDAHQK